MRYFITAGEVSGDIYAAMLMREIKKIDADAEFFGFGGRQTAAEGLDSIAPIEKLSVMGLAEVVKQYGFFRHLLKKCERLLIEKKIDVYIPIDYPGFNIRLAGYAKKAGIKVAYYIVPQLWAWGKNRAEKLKDCCDILLPVFPFEVDFYAKFGLKARTPGHPLTELPAFQQEITPVEKRKKQIAVMPGSRKQELDKHLPILRTAIEKLSLLYPEYKIATALPDEKTGRRAEEVFKNIPGFVRYPDSREMLRESRFGIIKSGTSNLEAALLGTPFIMFYKMSALTYFIGKRFVNVDKYSIVNILGDAETARELVQSDFTPEAVVEKSSTYLDNTGKLEAMQEKLIDIRNILGQTGASKKAAQIITNIRT